MRTDVTAGLAISALIHAGVFFGGHLFPSAPLLKKPPLPKEIVALVDLPKIEPDDPDIIEAPKEDVKPIEVAPPSQVDVPQAVTDTSQFVQRLQPPPPDDVMPNKSLLAVPDHRATEFSHIQVFDPSSLDQIPIARVRTPPTYPFEMKRQGVTGDVLVDFIVDTNGEVRNATAVRSTNREFEQPAVQAVSKWKFKPGRKGGHSVNTHLQVPIVFNLDGE